MYLAKVILIIQVVGCSFAASVSGNTQSAFHKITLERRYNNTYQHVAKHVSDFLKKGKSAEITLKDVQDMYYYGEITVGTPSQKILVDFDTGSADLWFSSSKVCKTRPTYCKNHSTYDHEKSKTYKENGTPILILYGKGEMSGFQSIDDISVGGLKVTDQTFGEATTISDNFVKYTVSDGIFGMGYKSLSAVDGTNPPFYNMINQGVVASPVFAFYLNKNEPSGDGITSGGAELVLGGVDRSHYEGGFTFTSVIEQKYWKINIDGVLLNSNKLSGTLATIVDSGTSLIYGPSEVIDPINKALNGQSGQLVDVECSKIKTFPDVTFIISNTSFVLHGQDYILKYLDVNNKVRCVSGFVAQDYQDPSLLLGDVFMRKFYTQFDMGSNRVGFATAK